MTTLAAHGTKSVLNVWHTLNVDISIRTSSVGTVVGISKTDMQR
jgi:hypothetical protein